MNHAWCQAVRQLECRAERESRARAFTATGEAHDTYGTVDVRQRPSYV